MSHDLTVAVDWTRNPEPARHIRLASLLIGPSALSEADDAVSVPPSNALSAVPPPPNPTAFTYTDTQPDEEKE